METSFVHISGRGIHGSSGVSCTNFLDRLQTGISSIKTNPPELNTPIRTASILDETIHPLGKVFHMIQMALYESLESAGLWNGEPWKIKSTENLQEVSSRFSANISGIPRKIGIFLGVSANNMSNYGERNYKKLYESLLKELNSKIQNDHTVFNEGISPICTAKLVRQLIGNSPIGPNVTIQNADVSSMQAIGEAFKAIQCGEIDLAITGGVQEYSLWTALNLEKYNLHSRENKVADACRPFDQRRQGIVLGEGSGILILESDLNLERRRKKAYGLIRSYAGSNHCHRLINHPLSGNGLTRAIKKCWQMASKPQIDLIIANAVGSRNIDASECTAIIDSQIGNPWVQSIKSFTGHTMASAGVYNVIAGLLQQERKFFSHTLHLESPDPHCDVNHIPHGGIQERVNFMLLNAMGLGGNNASLIVEFR
ncbi:MAG: beta-ketoacyl synthase N-terminal-like domain-containing protein [bacterium]|nr:beta-ketoacyl synthase N-terminal-like domain-containing protein [bacterium]